MTRIAFFLTLILMLAFSVSVDAQNCTTVQQLSPVAGYSGNTEVTQCGDLVYLSGEIQCSSPSWSTVLATGLAPAYRPGKDLYFAANVSTPNGSRPAEITVTQNGEVKLSYMKFVTGQTAPSFISSGETLRFTISYPK